MTHISAAFVAWIKEPAPSLVLDSYAFKGPLLAAMQTEQRRPTNRRSARPIRSSYAENGTANWYDRIMDNRTRDAVRKLLGLGKRNRRGHAKLEKPPPVGTASSPCDLGGQIRVGAAGDGIPRRAPQQRHWPLPVWFDLDHPWDVPGPGPGAGPKGNSDK